MPSLHCTIVWSEEQVYRLVCSPFGVGRECNRTLSLQLRSGRYGKASLLLDASL